jgi:hypothetical protein
MKNHFGQTENQIGIGRHKEVEIKTLNHMQNLPNTTLTNERQSRSRSRNNTGSYNRSRETSNNRKKRRRL